MTNGYGAAQIDPIYLNGWIAVWQFITSLPFAIPAAYATPGGSVSALPHMLWGGLKCYMGVNSVHAVVCKARYSLFIPTGIKLKTPCTLFSMPFSFRASLELIK